MHKALDFVGCLDDFCWASSNHPPYRGIAQQNILYPLLLCGLMSRTHSNLISHLIHSSSTLSFSTLSFSSPPSRRVAGRETPPLSFLRWRVVGACSLSPFLSSSGESWGHVPLPFLSFAGEPRGAQPWPAQANRRPSSWRQRRAQLG